MTTFLSTPAPAQESDEPIGKGSLLSPFLWSAAGVLVATAILWLLRHYLDKGQASLLYLPVVIVFAVRLGFGPAIVGAVLSFLCWDWFFLPPYGTLDVLDPKDWISLIVFLLAAMITARLAAQAREQSIAARAREREIEQLLQASQTVSSEIGAERLLAALAAQLRVLCEATDCLVFRHSESDTSTEAFGENVKERPQVPDWIRKTADYCRQEDQEIGFGGDRHLWNKAIMQAAPEAGDKAITELGAFLPLHARDQRVGVLYVGPRRDKTPYSGRDERLIRTLANHAAVVIARDRLAQEAGQAAALREADTLKDSLMSLVSHELRTPLAAIKASVSGLLQPEAHWEVQGGREALTGIESEVDRLTGVVEDLLDLSRLDGGAWKPAKDWIDLEDLVGTVLGRLPVVDAARVRVTAEAQLPLIRADYVQLALLVTNLLENAAKYSPPDEEILLSIGASAPAPNEAADRVVLRVRDFGVGIAPGEEERIFERFYRGKRERASDIHGTGLGLALCKAVAVAHNGRIWATNSPRSERNGAVIQLELPVS